MKQEFNLRIDKKKFSSKKILPGVLANGVDLLLVK